MMLLRVISRLLEYPDAELWQHHAELLAALEEDHPQLDAFIHQLCQQPLLDAQAQWGEWFDRGRSTSLLLFEHVHGESRDRGQAMVDLMAQYQQVGLQLSRRELPDYLPLYLEYLSCLPQAQARQGLTDIAPILALLGGRLAQRECRYQLLFDTLLALADSPLSSADAAAQTAGEARDDTPQALDAVWQETQVQFGASADCGSSVEHQHQRRFAGAVTPQYLDLTAGGSR